MASWASMGHGMRRRTGAPSNHLESAGKSMARSHKTSDEAYTDAANANSVRIPVGAAKTYVGTAGTAVPKKNTQAGDPTAGGKANRTNIENIGATYRVQPKSGYVQVDPAAGPTMASAKIIPSVSGRNSFDSGVQSASL
ncbi:hypothetical protein UFOVP46_64 [uncultured Caudovirales phage]|uniref:Uncharacterized protein n=1 Tax=uncultured Caudovirales phage TaxID=2100421 RepID=A0A6J5KTZ8_9CAUD|nr:hypothetical protein UFOVP46_64 [uncultured Caudovirales phage]